MGYVTPSECYVPASQACTVASGYTAAVSIENYHAAYQNGLTLGLQSVILLLAVKMGKVCSAGHNGLTSLLQGAMPLLRKVGLLLLATKL